jgi:hypothetical protein
MSGCAALRRNGVLAQISRRSGASLKPWGLQLPPIERITVGGQEKLRSFAVAA